MKRKIIKQGNNAYTITLPTKWVKQLNLNPKDELDLIEEGNQLIINAKKNSLKNSISFNISDMPIPLIWKYISTVYREGYDEIIIKFSNPYKKYENVYGFSTSYSKDLNLPKYQKTVLPTIQDIVNRFIGIEIIDFKEDCCIIRQMEEPSDKQFENSKRRIFMILNQLFEDLIKAVEESNFKFLDETHLNDTNLDRFYDFCCRVLNKTGSQSQNKSQLTFATLYLLELLGDEFKAISNILINLEKIERKKDLTKFLEIIYAQFKKYGNLYYTFNHDEIKNIYNNLAELFKDSPKVSSKKCKEIDTYYHLRKISEIIYSLVELRLEEEFHNKSISM